MELAELRAGDRLDTIIKLAGLVGARRTYRMVLVWFSEHEDPTGRPTVFNAAKIGQFWLALGKRCIQEAAWFWRKLGVLKFTERQTSMDRS